MTIRSIFCALLLCCCLVGVVVPTQAATLYTIGNSLTNDMVPEGVGALASDSGTPLAVGFHIRAASSLTYIVANPADPTFTLGGPWNTALRDTAWDHVTLQPYRGAGSTLGSEKAAIHTLIDLARAGPSSQTRFYVYAAWPGQDDTAGNYAEYWRQPVSSAATQPTTLAKAYFDELHRQLQQDYRGVADVRVIPVGDVFLRLDQEFRAGKYPGITSINDLYRDPVHMGDVGRFAAAATVYCTIYGRAPVIGSAIGIYQGGLGAIPLTTDLAGWVANIACDVVANDPRTKAAQASTDNRGSSGGGAADSGVLLVLVVLAAALRRRQATTHCSKSIQRPAADSKV